MERKPSFSSYEIPTNGRLVALIAGSLSLFGIALTVSLSNVACVPSASRGAPNDGSMRARVVSVEARGALHQE